MQNPNQPEEKTGWKKWLKRGGIGAFLFFTIKGIAWLFIFYFGAEMFQGCLNK